MIIVKLIKVNKIMSVICSTNHGWVVDHQHLVNKWYENCNLTTSVIFKDGKLVMTGSFQLKDILFQINSAFMMDSQFEKQQTDVNNTAIQKTRRKRKRKKMPDDDADIMINTRITAAHTELMKLANQHSYFIQVTDTKDNNRLARLGAKIIGDGDKLLQILESSQDTSDKSKIIIENCKGINDVTKSIEVNKIVHYTGNTSVQIQIYGDKYLLPPDSTFLLSDWKQLLITDITDDKGFDLVVMDPPWINKSVKRKKSYNTVWEDTLLKLPVDNILNDGCIIVIWVTNKTRLHSFIKNTLLPTWNIQQSVEWHWLKVTKDGGMICEIDSTMKKPYETLFLAQFNKSTASSRPTLPDHQTIISVPCSLHSKKPPLSEILHPYLPSNPKCLELFARNLQPGWTSWGNEVLKHQHMDFYELKTF